MRTSQCRNDMVVAVAAIGCALLVISTFQTRPVSAEEVDEDVAEEFWDKFVNQSYPGSTSSFTPLEKSVLAQYSKDRRQQKALERAGIGAGVGAAVMGMLTPLLLLKAHQGTDAAAAAAKAAAELSEADQAPVITTKDGGVQRRGAFGRMRDFLAMKDDSARKVGVGVGSTAVTLGLAMAGLLLASHLTDKKIKKERRKFRNVMARQRKDKEGKESGSSNSHNNNPAGEGDAARLGQPTVEDIMKAIEEAQNPTGPLNRPPTVP